MDYKLSVTDVADDSVQAAIRAPLVAYNQDKAGTSDYRALVVTLTDPEGKVIGGLWGRTAYSWLFVELLFVPEHLRGRGLGKTLLQQAEQEASKRGCRNAWLDTYEFQARGFYEHLGYRCFGELPDYPPGFSRYFLTKRL